MVGSLGGTTDNVRGGDADVRRHAAGGLRVVDISGSILRAP
ncbi:hypothetical protein N7925_20485 [Streptomyces sp. CA-278952]|nr:MULTISPECIES: hypothetical protein [unclassified Streptomyces]UZI30546.1 hypothetical protein OH133_21875 [Streptomyces sp. VB1]WDG30542.1 hypothetical protein N7925_20485 [Streptomyces sp. CA-278952]